MRITVTRVYLFLRLKESITKKFILFIFLYPLSVIHYSRFPFSRFPLYIRFRELIMQKSKEFIVIGRSDKADFPELKLKNINVKIDSGAYTSAIHCCKISLADYEKLEVIFLDDEDPNYTGEIYTFENFIKKNVRSSNGISEERFIVSTKILFHEHIFDINLSLTFRGDMRFPVLIGRRFLARNHFLVNPRLKNRFHKKSLKKPKRS